MSLKYALRYAYSIGALVLANPVQLRSSSDFANSNTQLHSTSDHLVRNLDATISSKRSPAPKLTDYTIIPPHPPSDLGTLSLYSTNASNGSVPSVNVTSDNKANIQCDGASYGVDLDIVDCEDAKAEVPASAEEYQWAERDTSWQKQIFALPYRSMGDKASCYVQTVLIGGATSAKASLNQVRNAAASIRHECASGGKLRGGIATNIGE